MMTHPLQHLHDGISLSLPKYKYVTKKWADCWVNGGSLPIRLASYYRREEQSGRYTPDEVTQYGFKGIAEEHLNELIHINPKGRGQVQIQVGEAYLGNTKVGHNVSVDRIEEDGLILCLSNKLSAAVVKCLNISDAVCIELLDATVLFNFLNTALGVNGIAAHCKYTNGAQRNHFLKGTASYCQDEFRMFWPLKEELIVNLPMGMGRLVDLPPSAADM